jgi:hypothetical protein
MGASDSVERYWSVSNRVRANQYPYNGPLEGSPVADGASSHGRKGFSSELIGRSTRLGSHLLERQAAAAMRDDQVLSTPLIKPSER